MTTLFIALKLLWRRKAANFVLLLQVLVSVAMLAQMYVFLVDHLDNVRAVGELPTENALVLPVFEYYPPAYAAERLEASPLVEEVAVVDTGGGTCGDTGCNVAIYGDGIVRHYTPALQSGGWLEGEAETEDGVLPAVVSQEVELRVGDTGTVRLNTGDTARIRVVGVLKRPTQYLYPTGSASPAYFSADFVISQEPAVLLRARDAAQSEAFQAAFSSSSFRTSRNLFVFLRPGITDAQYDKALEEWNRYGEITPAASLISTYTEKTGTLITAGLLTFCVFTALAMTSVVGSNVIQALRNRKLFTVYYLLGMDWRRSAFIEAARVGLMLIPMMAMVAAAGQGGLLMMEWMTPTRAKWFYGISFFYVLLMFASVGAVFIWRLTREDLSAALKALQKGE